MSSGGLRNRKGNTTAKPIPCDETEIVRQFPYPTGNQCMPSDADANRNRSGGSVDTARNDFARLTQPDEHAITPFIASHNTANAGRNQGPSGSKGKGFAGFPFTATSQFE